MAHNLARWTARIGLGEQLVTTKTLRRHLFSLAGRFTRSARRLTLHLPPALALGKPVQSRPGTIASPAISCLTAPSATDPPTSTSPNQPTARPPNSRQTSRRASPAASCSSLRGPHDRSQPPSRTSCPKYTGKTQPPCSLSPVPLTWLLRSVDSGLQSVFRTNVNALLASSFLENLLCITRCWRYYVTRIEAANHAHSMALMSPL